jgi:hypothetical protein
MNRINSLLVALMLSISAVQAGLPPEFEVANADGVLISYGICNSDWMSDCGENSVLVTFFEGGMKYAGDIAIPESVIHNGTTYNVVGIAYAFFSCPELTAIRIPESVSFIVPYAFEGSPLTDIYVKWSDPAEVYVDGTSFVGINASDITLHVLTGTKELYENSDVWKDFNIVDDGGITDNMAKLGSLTVTVGTLSPAFSPAIYAYSLSVPLSVESTTLTAAALYGGTVSGDGQKTLNIGENTFEITVTSSDGTQQNIYTVRIIRQDFDFVIKEIESVRQTGDFYFTDYLGAKMFIQDKVQVKYELTTGNLDNLSLRFTAGNKTQDKDISLSPYTIYEMYVRVWIDKTGTSSVTHFVNGKPSYSEIVYPNRTTETMAISLNSQPPLHAVVMEFLGPPERVEYLEVKKIGTIEPGTSIPETAAGKNAVYLSVNSANDYLTIFGLQGNETLRFYSINGTLLLGGKATGETTTVSIANLPAGMYLVGVQSEEGISTHKFVKR